MTREEIFAEMEETFGVVPSTVRHMPDEFLEHEWHLWKRLRMTETAIPAKEKELISLGIAAANRDWHSCMLHTEFAKVFGATEEQIREVAYLAKQGVGWLPYACANQITEEECKGEIDKMIEHCKAHAEERVAAASV